MGSIKVQDHLEVTVELKTPEEILLKILRRWFEEDLRSGNLPIAGDQIIWVLKSEKSTNYEFNRWLINEGYAHEKEKSDSSKNS